MYYSNGNYEAFAHPEKPEGIEKKSAYIVGTGLAGLSAACFLVRDAQMPGSHIHIFESDPVPGGACDGAFVEKFGFVCRGGREMENHFECLWDLFRSIPSIETPGVSVLDEYYWLNKHDPNFSLERAIMSGGESAHTDGKFDITPGAATQILKIFMTPDRELEDKKITDYFDDEFFNSNFWLYWQTMFAFQKWHSALEMKLYIHRFIHHIGGLPDFKALKFTKFNQYESLILPLIKYLESNGVSFEYNTAVTNIIFETSPEKKVAKQILVLRNGKEETINLTEDDYVFVTLGSNVDNATLGTNTTAPQIKDIPGSGRSWELWRKIAAQDPSFGHPEKFCGNIHDTLWESATVTTLDDKIPPYVEKICKRDPFSGKVVTGGIITIKDSSWLMSFTFNRQPHFKQQKKDQLCGWIYALNCDVPGDYIKKPIKECTGIEICEEWLYHIGVPEDKIADYATNHANTVPCIMPYVTTYFMPRAAGDRPKVVPDGAVNFGFLGEHVETPRDTVFTTEYAVRTGMEAVYTLMNVDRGVPEVFASVYDVRVLLESTVKLLDGRKPLEVFLPVLLPILATVKDKAENNVVTDLLKKYNMI
ncbi:MAG: oleate hydratase [Clostridiales bacterium]|nr:oleate hydratase [Clostridiales bacterium]